jgi:hypothetical protein
VAIFGKKQRARKIAIILINNFLFFIIPPHFNLL